jgi:hypothetical protein
MSKTLSVYNMRRQSCKTLSTTDPQHLRANRQLHSADVPRRYRCRCPCCATSLCDIQAGSKSMVDRTPPMIMTRRRSVRKSTLRIIPSMSSTLPPTRLPSEDPLLAQPSFRYGNSSSTRTSKAEGSIERRMNALLVRSTRSADSTRPSTAAAHMHREYSMGDLSDAPSYFTGPPPPSYRSRPASILTTSSFGCIDGMSPAQRQISRQRAALQRGVKGRLKRLAQNFTSSTSRSTDS